MLNKIFASLCFAGLLATSAIAQSAHFHIFILFGQSNMEGVPQPEAVDTVTDPRIQVLAYNSCSNLTPTRVYDQWYTASPPLHSCYLGVGPGDYFAKTLLKSIPAGDTIGLVPCAIAGVDIDFFRKGIVSARRSQFTIPPDNSYTGAYQFMLDRAKLAQQRGVIEGMLFHQGESNAGQLTWVGQVREIVTDLRADLGIPNLPFVAGEVLYNGCCSTHNFRVKQIPDSISNSAIVSAALDESIYWSASVAGLPMYTGDTYKAHFNLEGQRELGRRYAMKMMPMLPAGLVTATREVNAINAFEVHKVLGGLLVTSSMEFTQISMVNMNGAVSKIAANSSGFISTQGIPQGLYILRVSDGSKRFQRLWLID